MERLHEPVRVAVIFAPGLPPKPVWFEWRRRKHEVREITYRWQEQDGERITLHFAVTDGATLFELVFDAVDRSWMIRATEPEPHHAYPPATKKSRSY